MFLKFRYRLGYESLCAEVSDSISWRRFCRIPLDAKVPHPTTLMKLTTRCGAGAVAGLNEALLARAAGARLLRTARVRADTTVIGANVAYPTDCALLAKAVGKLVRAARRVRAAGGAAGTVMRDRRRAAGRRVRQVAISLRSRGKLATQERSALISRVTGELAGLAETTAAQGAMVLRNGRYLVWARGIRPQPGQDQRPSRMTRPDHPSLPLHCRSELSPPTFSGRSNYSCFRVRRLRARWSMCCW